MLLLRNILDGTWVRSEDTFSRQGTSYEITSINYRERSAKVREFGKAVAWRRNEQELLKLGLEFREIRDI